MEQEGRLLLAIEAIQKKEIPSIREVARQFDIPRSTFYTRLYSVTYRAEIRANNYKLT